MSHLYFTCNLRTNWNAFIASKLSKLLNCACSLILSLFLRNWKLILFIHWYHTDKHRWQMEQICSIWSSARALRTFQITYCFFTHSTTVITLLCSWRYADKGDQSRMFAVIIAQYTVGLKTEKYWHGMRKGWQTSRNKCIKDDFYIKWSQSCE